MVFVLQGAKNSWLLFQKGNKFITSWCNVLPSLNKVFTLPYLTLPYLTLPYLTLPYLILSYLILSYLILSYLILSYRIVWPKFKLKATFLVLQPGKEEL